MIEWNSGRALNYCYNMEREEFIEWNQALYYKYKRFIYEGFVKVVIIAKEYINIV